MSKKKKKDKIVKFDFLDIYKSCRKLWPISPVQKALPNKKRKSRAKTKQDFKRDLKNEL